MLQAEGYLFAYGNLMHPKISAGIVSRVSNINDYTLESTDEYQFHGEPLVPARVDGYRRRFGHRVPENQIPEDGPYAEAENRGALTMTEDPAQQVAGVLLPLTEDEIEHAVEKEVEAGYERVSIDPEHISPLEDAGLPVDEPVTAVVGEEVEEGLQPVIPYARDCYEAAELLGFGDAFLETTFVAGEPLAESEWLAAIQS